MKNCLFRSMEPLHQTSAQCTPLQPDYVLGFSLLSREVPVGGCVGRGGVGPSRWVHADVSVLLDVLVHAEGASLVEHLGAAPGHEVTTVSNFHTNFNKPK